MSENTQLAADNGFFSFKTLRTGAFLVGRICSALSSNAANGRASNAPFTMGPLEFTQSGGIYLIKNTADKTILIAVTSTDNQGNALFKNFTLSPNDIYRDQDNLIANNLTGQMSYTVVQSNSPMQFSITNWSNTNPFVVLNNTLTVNFIPDPTNPKIRIAADRDYTDIRITLVTQNKESYSFGPLNIDHKQVAVDIDCPSNMDQTIPFKNFIIAFTPTSAAIERIVRL